MKRRFGLIGYPLSHSFSKEYFDHKFRNEKITDSEYENYELKEIREFRHWLEIHTEILGLNVTIPYKESVMTYLDQLDPGAKRIGAVNVIKKMPDGHLKGYNSDYYGFRTSLERWLGKNFVNTGVLVLGGGGAAKAVIAVLEDCNLEFLKVSRTEGKDRITYYDIRRDPGLLKKYKLIINTTPLGMYPKTNEMPNLPYESLDDSNFLYDLIYNPDKTLFLKNGESKGAGIKNGKEMLILQADRSWQIWNTKD